MMKDSKISSQILHLSQLQNVNHKIFDEYRDRLKTYEDSLWFGKSDEISAIECARRGWICRGNDSIECINCHAKLLAQLPSVLNMDQYRQCVEKITRSLVDSHHQYCVWKFMIIPESIVQLTDIYSNETVNRLLHEAEEFLPRFQRIQIVGPLISDFHIEPTDFDILSSSYLNDPRLLAAFQIVAFSWKLKDHLLICEKCCREISVNATDLTFDPIVSHRIWCPILKNQYWKKRLEQIDSILHKKSQSFAAALPNNSDKSSDHILNEILSTQEFFHQLISSKEYYRSCVQNTFDDQTSGTDIDPSTKKSM